MHTDLVYFFVIVSQLRWAPNCISANSAPDGQVVVFNGSDLGIVWARPFRVDVTGALKTGENSLQVSVINSWRNRLIGDRNLRGNERYTETNITVGRDWRLEESGLLGPVQILKDMIE